ncbi:MAG: MFS transporter [Actinomycetota bacterium]|nr:MFS transporter [Actinomycetota bacterium]
MTATELTAVPGPITSRPRPGPARLLGVSSLAHFLNDGVVFFVPVVGDLLSQDHHLSTVMVTAMLTVFYVTSAGFGVAVGLAADAIGRRGPMIAVGIATLGASLFGFYASLSLTGVPSDTLVLVAAAVAGVGSSFYHPLGGSVLQLGFPESSRGRALGINGAAGSLGRALYPALFFVIAAIGISRPATTVVFGALSLLAALAVAVGLPAEPIGPAGPRPTARTAVLAPAPGQPGGTAERTSAPGAEARVGTSSPSPAAPLRSLLSRSVVALMAISFFRSLAFIGIVSWIPIYLTTERHAGLSTGLGWTVTVMYAGGIVGQPLFGLLADRFDKRFVLALDSLGSALGIFLFLSTAGHGAAALVALAVFGLFTFSGFPLLMSLVADYVPRASSTTGNALVWGVGSTGGQALGPLAVSLLMGGSHAHLGLAFAVLGAVAAATVVGTPLLQRTERPARMALFG